MARFYKTSKPQFIDNIIYQPPWKLIDEVMGAKQEQYDNALASTELLRGMLDIKHRNSEADTRAAQEIANVYNSEIDSLVSQLQSNPDSASKVQRDMLKLSRQLKEDKKYGDIFKLESTYNNYQAALKKAEEARKNGDIVTYNAIMKWADGYNADGSKREGGWHGDTLNNGIWQYEEVIGTPEILKDKKAFVEMLTKLPEMQNVTVERGPTGDGYRFIDKKTNTEVPLSKIVQLTSGLLDADPNLMSWMEQQQRIGIPGANYFNMKDGKIDSVIPYYKFEYINTETGKKIEPEEFDKIEDPILKSKYEPLLNTAENAVGKMYDIAMPYSYSKQDRTYNETVDQVAENAKKREHDILIQQEGFRHDEKMEAAKQKNRIALGIANGSIPQEALAEDIITVTNFQMKTPEELKQDQKDFFNLLEEYTADPDNMSPERKERFNSLEAQYSKYLEGFGITTEEYFLFNKLQQNPNFGRVPDRKGEYHTVKTYDGYENRFTPTESEEEYQNRVEQHKKSKLYEDWIRAQQVQDKLGDTKEEIAKANVEIASSISEGIPVFMPSRYTPIGNSVLNMGDILLSSGEFEVFNGDYEIEGREGRRPQLKEGIEEIQEFLEDNPGAKIEDVLQGVQYYGYNDDHVYTGTFNGKKVSVAFNKVSNRTLTKNILESDAFKSPEGEDWKNRHLISKSVDYNNIRNKTNTAITNSQHNNNSLVTIGNTGLAIRAIGTAGSSGNTMIMSKIEDFPKPITSYEKSVDPEQGYSPFEIMAINLRFENGMNNYKKIHGEYPAKNTEEYRKIFYSAILNSYQ